MNKNIFTLIIALGVSSHLLGSSKEKIHIENKQKAKIIGENIRLSFEISSLIDVSIPTKDYKKECVKTLIIKENNNETGLNIERYSERFFNIVDFCVDSLRKRNFEEIATNNININKKG